MAKRLVRELDALDGMNEAAARYAIDLGRATGLIQDNHIWTARGHVLALISSPDEAVGGFDLSEREKVFFFRTFLETDGAALTYFFNKFGTCPQLPNEKESWNSIANDLFISTFRSYASIATDLASRIRLRQLIEKRQKKPFSGAHSGEHQSFVHVQTMFRLGLVQKGGRGRVVRVYKRLSGQASEKANYLASQLSDVSVLEDAIGKQRWGEFACRLYAPPTAGGMHSRTQSIEAFYKELFIAYRRLAFTGIPLCPLRTLVEATQIEEIVRGQQVSTFDDRIVDLKQLQRLHPKQVHFHVDAIGRPAYLKLDPSLVAA